jgi:transmembrane sensor
LPVLYLANTIMVEEDIWNLIAKKLAGEASQQELFELEILLKNKPDLHYSVQTVIDLWNTRGRENRKEASKAFERHLLRMKDLSIDLGEDSSDASALRENKNNIIRKKSFAVWTGASLVLLTALVLTLLLLHSPGSNQEPPALRTNSEISTRNGSRTNLVLPDGTSVWLNAGSKLSYDKNFGNRLREINLVGEAFFDVTKNANKPFIIHTARIDIKVLGTQFNVKSYPSDKTTVATLLRGSLEVSIRDRPNQKIILRPNEKIVVANDSNPTPSSTDAYTIKSVEPIVAIRRPVYDSANHSIIETSWIENKLIFHDQTFSGLAEEMERWYGVTIRFDDPEQKELRFTGSFKNETIQQALDALKFSGEFNYRIKGNEIHILK